MTLIKYSVAMNGHMKSGRRALTHDEFLDKCELSVETIAQLRQCLICTMIAGFLRTSMKSKDKALSSSTLCQKRKWFGFEFPAEIPAGY